MKMNDANYGIGHLGAFGMSLAPDSSYLSLHDKWDLDPNAVGHMPKFAPDFVYSAALTKLGIETRTKDLQIFAGITKEIVLTASGNLIEIWDKEKYETSINISPDQFSALTEDVMGNTTKRNLDGIS